MSLDRILAIVGLVGTFAGIPIAIYLSRKARIKPVLCWARQFTVLVRPHESVSQDGLRLEYRGTEIQNLSRTTIAFWVDSGSTVHSADIAVQDPLRAEVQEGDRILQVRGVSRSRKQNQVEFQISETSRSVFVDFDFLDASDGYIFEILHSGSRSAQVCGTVRGATIHSRGSASLDEGSLDTIAVHPLKRFLTRSIDGNRRGAVGILWMIVFYGSLIGVFAWLGRSAVEGFTDEPEAVNVSEYDLATISGQTEFAEAVDDASNAGASGGIAMVIIMLFLLGVVWFVVLSSYRAKVPRSIVSDRRSTSDAGLWRRGE